MNYQPSSSQHHSFDVYHAKQYGITEAILIHHLSHWIREHRTKKENFFEGRTWNYMTTNEIVARYPYLTYEQVRYALRRLEKENIILKGKFNKRKGDNTLWFSFQNEERFVPFFSEEEKHQFYEGVGKFTGVCENSQGSVKIPTALPDPKTDTETQREEEIKKKEGCAPFSSFFSEKEKELVNFLHEEILRRKPDFIKKPSKTCLKSSKKLLESRSMDSLKQSILWALEHEFWGSTILSVSGLLKNLDKIEIQMKNYKGSSKWKTMTKRERSEICNDTSLEKNLPERHFQVPGLILNMLQE